MVGGVDRDWIIVIECSADGISLPLWKERFDISDLGRQDNPLLKRLETMIRQQLKRQPDVRPALKYRINGDGLRAYYEAARDLEALRLPASTERILPPAKSIPPAAKKTGETP